jgi:(1->4)-alpha-D-glucan 1-alpha-D-glucosylmutase
LEARRAHRDVFEKGGYIPLKAKGRHAENLCAFARHHEGDWMLAVVPRLLSRVVDAGSFPLGAKSWGTSTIELPVKAQNLWNNIFTGETVKSLKREGKIVIRVSELFEKFPILCARSV